MNNRWLAEVTNDPRRDYDLCIQLSEADAHWALIERTDSGELVLSVDPSEKPVQIPAKWLAEILIAAEKDLGRR